MLALPVSAFSGETCAGSFAEAGELLGRLNFPRVWREVTMNDGKPLVLRISGGESLRLSFVKTGEGLWAEGPVRICRSNARIEAEIAAEQMTVGPAANWAVRQMLSGGATFELMPRKDGQLRITTGAWTGDFERLDF